MLVLEIDGIKTATQMAVPLKRLGAGPLHEVSKEDVGCRR